MAPGNSRSREPRRPSIPLQSIETHPHSRSRAGSQPHSPTTAVQVASIPGISTYWDQPYNSAYHDVASPDSPIDPTALQVALPPGIHEPSQDHPDLSSYPVSYERSVSCAEDAESDRVPLTASAEPISRSLHLNTTDSQPRDSFQTVSDVDNHPIRSSGRGLGHNLDVNLGHARNISYGASLSPNEYRRQRSPSTTSGALSRAQSMVRAMSQRVVNISGESEVLDYRASRQRSRSIVELERTSSRETAASMLVDTSYPPQVPQSGAEKSDVPQFSISPSSQPPPRHAKPNPLKGKSLGIFSPDNRLRLWLCDLLVNPYAEPVLLLLIILQAVLLAVEAAPNVFDHPRPKKWGTQAFDWVILALFIVFTLEMVAHIIVSGFILNAAEYSTIDRSRGIRAAIADQYRAVFQPQQQKTTSSKQQFEPSTISRSFTTFMQGQQNLPRTFEDQKRFQLARRAFLRHSFNRIDLIAVISYWISFVLSISEVESSRHIYVFRMLSCLRILRLLALTNGTTIILSSLKKATPLLLRVAFLLSFFWLLFAIIGVQSFKGSFSRRCVWLDPLDPTNFSAAYINDDSFCGGYLKNDSDTREVLPWLKAPHDGTLKGLEPGTRDGKGYTCPRGSICLAQYNPYNGTVSFDNIFNSLELVFVIMSANTYSTLMYDTIGSDYTSSALFFGSGIMILTLWMTNLLIAVITSSFQVMREESMASAFTVDQTPYSQTRTEEMGLYASPLQRLYNKCRPIFLLIIAFDLICQAWRSATMSSDRENFINTAEIIVTIILDFEIVFRFFADWKRFHRSWRNLFDLGLAVITSIILIPPIHGTRAYTWFTFFQILRVYRLVMAIPVTRELILLVLGNAAGIGNLVIFVFLMTFLVAILAAQLFRGEIPMYDDGNLNEVSFYTIFNSFLGMYQILTTENWTDILFGVTSYTSEWNTGWIGATLLVGWFIVSFFILVNMFIAVIQENFDVSEDEKRLQQVKAFLQRRDLGNPSSNLALSTIFSFGRGRKHKDPLDYGPATMEMLLKDAVVREFLDDQMDRMAGGDRPQPQRSATTLMVLDSKPGFMSKVWDKCAKIFGAREPNPFYTDIRMAIMSDTQDPRQMAQQAVSATSARRRAQREYLARHPTYNNSLYFFSSDNRLRRLCQRLVGPARGPERFDGVEPNKVAWYSFSIFIYASIVAMVILACITTPLYQKEYQAQTDHSFTNWYIWTDMAFAIIFTVETVIKIIADGLIWTPNAYLRSSWGIMDAAVLITLWINVVTLLVNDDAISRAIGAFKALRALRLLNVSDTARNTFHDLIIVGWWKILGAAFVSLSLLIPFAIYGLNLFAGLMVSCNDSGNTITLLEQCYGEYENAPFSDDWPMLMPRVASNTYFNFDDFAASLFTLFQLTSQEGWIDASYLAQSIVGRGKQPQDLYAEGNAIFFVVFNLLATVFVLNLFISVFMRNYTEQTGVAFLTAEQRSWLELRKILRQISPSKSSYDDSEQPWKKWCHKRAIEKRGKWYRSITIILCFHLVLLVSEFASEPAWWRSTRDGLFFVFVLAYMANIAIRILGLGWTRFRRSSWDLYSIIVVLGSFIATLVLFFTGHFQSTDETSSQVHKVFLVAIVLLIIPRNDALDQLFKTAAASLTIIGNLLATWLVFFLVFAIATTQAFSLTRFGSQETSDTNFRTVPKALLLLFRMSFGEGWNQVMEDFADIEPPLCVKSDRFFDSDCGSKTWARFLFVAWNIVSMFIFVNLFISLIYESFSYVYQRSSGTAMVDRDEIRRFKEAWRSVDPAGTGYISKDAFPRLLGELSGAFEMRIYDSEDSVRSIVEDCQSDGQMSRHGSVAAAATGSNQYGIDINKLNRRLANLDVATIRQRRRRFNLFYEEVLVSADPDRGITFTTVLMILAHYNIINDSKSLKLEEFLRRRARLQRVEEQVRRGIVLGFFDTLYWSRKFRQHMQRKQSARMSAIPRLDVPDILVDDDVDDGGPGPGSSRMPHGPKSPTSPGFGPGQTGDLSLHDSMWQHPLSFPRAAPPSPSSHHVAPSAFSFELQESDHPAPRAKRESVPPETPVSPSQVREMLDDSVWVESIRRSATIRRSQYRGSYRYGDR